MSSFFRRTKLWAQIQDIRGEYALLRRNRHRAAIRAKKDLVRLHVIRELERKKMDLIHMRVETMMSAASIAAVHNVRKAREERRMAIEKIAREKAGITLPSLEPEQEGADAFKARVAKQIKGKIPKDARGVTAGKIFDSVLQESMQSVKLKEDQSPEERNIDLAASLIKQTGLSRAELETMLGQPKDEMDAEVSSYLKERLMKHVRDDDVEKPSGQEAEDVPERRTSSV